MSIGEEVYELADILYKNKEYNLLWHDCIYLADQIVERIHSMDKNNIKTTDWLTRGMTKEQIAREKSEAIMAADLELCYTERMGVSKFYPDYDAIAERMYEIGYRQQVEGKWLKLASRYAHAEGFPPNATDAEKEGYLEALEHQVNCSICSSGFNDRDAVNWHFCPYC